MLYTNDQDVTVSLVTKDAIFDVSQPITYKELLKFLKASHIQLSKGTVVQELNTKYSNTSKETSEVIKVGRTQNWMSRKNTYHRNNGPTPETTGDMKL